MNIARKTKIAITVSKGELIQLLQQHSKALEVQLLPATGKDVKMTQLGETVLTLEFENGESLR